MIWDYYNSIIIEYQKIINLLDNILNQPSKFKTKNWVKINDESGRIYDEVNQTRFKTLMLKVHWCRFENDPENFAFLILGILELYTCKVCEMFVYKYAETIEYVKN